MAITIPQTIHAGDTLTIKVSGADTRDCSVTLNNINGKYTAVASVVDGFWVCIFQSAQTSSFIPGNYSYHIGLVDAGERETLQTGLIEIKPDLTAASYDVRSHAEKVLEAIEATLEGKATSDHEETQINGRSIKRFAPEQLLSMRDRYRAEVAQIKRKERVKNGGLNTGIIHTRFS